MDVFGKNNPMIEFEWQKKTILIILVAIIFNVVAKWLLSALHTHFEKKKQIWKDGFVQALYLPLSIFVWLVAAAYASNLLLSEYFPKFSLENISLILAIAAILSIAWFAFRWKQTIIKLSVLKSRQGELAFDHGKIDVVDKIVTLLIIFFTVLLILEVTGRSMTTLIAFGGIGGLALAFASQEIIANCFGGLMIYTTRLFSVGDWINLPQNHIEGHVEEIGWYMTRIRTFNKRPIYVPNSTFAKTFVETPSRMSHRQFKEILHLRYQDMNLVRTIIEKIKDLLNRHPQIDKEQSINVYLESFGAYSIHIVVSAYTKTALDNESFNAVKQDILLSVIDILDAHGAKIAYNTLKYEDHD